MNQLNSLFSCAGDSLIAYNNEHYQKIPYRSDLHEQLVYQLQDPD